MPLPWIRAILGSNASDTRHRANAITATRVLTCSRQVAIEDNLPNVLDVRQLNTPFVGTAVHEVMEQTTGNDPFAAPEVSLKGKLFGVEIEGTLDKLSDEGTAIEDYKFHGESRQNFKFSATVDPELAAQLNIYRLLYEQNVVGPKVKRLGVWHGAIVSARSKAPAWFYRPVPFLSEREIAALKPHGASFTVQQLVGHLIEFKRALEALPALDPDEYRVAVRALIKKIPLVGRDMWRGTKCTTYCPVRRTCDDVEGIVGI